VTCPASNQLVVNQLSCANTTNFLITCSVTVTRSGVVTFIVRSADVPAGGSLICAGDDQKIVLMAGDVVQVQSSLANSIDAVVSGVLNDFNRSAVVPAPVVSLPPLPPAPAALAVFNFEEPNAQASGTITPTQTGTLSRNSTFALVGTRSAWGAFGFGYTLPQTIATYANSGGFTMDGFLYYTSAPVGGSLMGVFGAGASDYIGLIISNLSTGLMRSGTNGGTGSGITWPSPALDRWVHVFITWFGNRVHVGVNGRYDTQTGPSDNFNINNFPNINQVYIGTTPKFGTGITTGQNMQYADQFRLINGNPFIANPSLQLVNQTYTVPTPPLT
jgi:hypothetical protein